MAWKRRAESPAAALAELRVGGRRKIRVRLRVIPRCQGGGAAARWAHGPLLAPPPPRAGRVRRGIRLVQRTQQPASPPADPGLVPHRRARDLVDGRRRQRRGRARGCCRTTWPSAPPSPTSARSRSHDSGAETVSVHSGHRETGRNRRERMETTMATEQVKDTAGGKMPALNIERVYSTTVPAGELAQAIASHFRAKEFETQVFRTGEDRTVMQARKESLWRNLLGVRGTRLGHPPRLGWATCDRWGCRRPAGSIRLPALVGNRRHRRGRSALCDRHPDHRPQRRRHAVRRHEQRRPVRAGRHRHLLSDPRVRSRNAPTHGLQPNQRRHGPR